MLILILVPQWSCCCFLLVIAFAFNEISLRKLNLVKIRDTTSIFTNCLHELRPCKEDNFCKIQLSLPWLHASCACSTYQVFQWCFSIVIPCACLYLTCPTSHFAMYLSCCELWTEEVSSDWCSFLSYGLCHMNHNTWQVGWVGLSAGGINSSWNSAILSSEKEGWTLMVGNLFILQLLENLLM